MFQIWGLEFRDWDSSPGFAGLGLKLEFWTQDSDLAWTGDLQDSDGDSAVGGLESLHKLN
jgi:hypothetical protein